MSFKRFSLASSLVLFTLATPLANSQEQTIDLSALIAQMQGGAKKNDNPKVVAVEFDSFSCKKVKKEGGLDNESTFVLGERNEEGDTQNDPVTNQPIEIIKSLNYSAEFSENPFIEGGEAVENAFLNFDPKNLGESPKDKSSIDYRVAITFEPDEATKNVNFDYSTEQTISKIQESFLRLGTSLIDSQKEDMKKKARSQKLEKVQPGAKLTEFKSNTALTETLKAALVEAKFSEYVFDPALEKEFEEAKQKQQAGTLKPQEAVAIQAKLKAADEKASKEVAAAFEPLWAITQKDLSKANALLMIQNPVLEKASSKIKLQTNFFACEVKSKVEYAPEKKTPTPAPAAGTSIVIPGVPSMIIPADGKMLIPQAKETPESTPKSAAPAAATTKEDEAKKKHPPFVKATNCVECHKGSN